MRFLAAGAPEPLLVVEDVAVVAGELNRDPRLQNVDLGRFLSARVVTVLDEHDAPIRKARIGARPKSDAAGAFVSFETGPDGRAAVVMPAGPVEVVVASGGYRSVVLPAVTEDVTVRLRKATPRPVTVRLADGVVPPRAPFRLEVELRMLASPGQIRPKDRNADDPRNSLVNETAPLARSAVLSVDEPGLYEVQLWLHHAAPSASMNVPLAQAGGIATVVVSEQGEASVTVAPDPEDLKAAIARRKGE